MGESDAMNRSEAGDEREQSGAMSESEVARWTGAAR